MKKIFLGLLSLLWGITAVAQNVDYLTFRTLDGSEVSLPVDGLKMTFEGKQLHAVAQQRSVDFVLADMEMMFFSATPTAVESVIRQADGVAIVNGKLIVNVPVNTSVLVYTMDGRRLDNNSTIPNGIYLVKVNGRTFKVMSR